MNFSSLPMPDSCQLRPPSSKVPTDTTVRRYHPYETARVRQVNKLDLPHLNNFPSSNGAIPCTSAQDVVARLPWAVQSVPMPSCGSYKIVKQKQIKAETLSSSQSITKTITTIDHALVIPNGRSHNTNKKVFTKFYSTLYPIPFYHRIYIYGLVGLH